jgi:DNA polymerase III delta prime subunit|tara:strand:+ start:53502 stop:54446 length:945 start_codon:yes stop_codon:yes gene_type:complete
MADFLWVEKYRPKTIEECILPEDIKSTFQNFLKQGEIPNLLLSGTAGTGKTTVARALCEELKCDYLIINGSDEGRQIDTLRTKIKNFASTVSLTEDANHKVVIIDEADYTNADSVQPAMRAFMEEFHNNCRFILTCNFKNKIIPPLHSRCTVVDFRIVNGQKKKCADAMMIRLGKVLDDKGIPFDKKVLAELIIKYFPDFRRTINELQRYSVRGKIDSGILFTLSEANNKELVATLKEKRFNDMRKWVIQNIDKEPTSMFRNLYEVLWKALEAKSIPQAVLVIAGYQYKAAFVADQEINMVACLTEIMANCKFK